MSGNLKIEEFSNMKKLLEDVVYEDKNGVVFTVPKGYISDYASIPRAFSWIFPKDGPYRKAAVLHDYLITNGLVKKEFDIKSNRVDQIFKEAMLSTDIPRIRANIMWMGVRLGALGNKHRRAGSLKTLPKVLAILILSTPFIAIPSIVVEVFLLLLYVLTLPLPKKQKLTAQKT